MTVTRRLLAALLALLLAAPVFAQPQRTYSQPELDQMLAPVALYPDPLLAQVLMAATYPLEVAAAARWSRANPGLQGDDAVRAVEYQDWDPSVKSLVAFPQILARMGENPEWTRRLGEAFLAQQPYVMNTVQQLRGRARAAGQLASDARLNVVEQPNSIAIQAVNAQVVYVPYYDPRIVYGPWWWPAYQPVVWAPWPGYVRAYRPPLVVNRIVVVTPHHWQQEPRYQNRREDHRISARSERAPAVQVQARPQVQPQVRMPAAVAPQHPRAERREPRNEHGHRGRERS